MTTVRYHALMAGGSFAVGMICLFEPLRGFGILPEAAIPLESPWTLLGVPVGLAMFWYHWRKAK